ncbi:MAG: ribosome biogenesis GTPase YlqF [Pseudomonadota bacterium]
MNINWYPGHMHKARKAILNTLNAIDVLIELVDARVPFSSQNPVIAQWRESKPTIVILNKTDLADPEYSQAWQTHMETQANIKTLSYHKDDKNRLQQISELCYKLCPQKADSFKAINGMIVGIPNVGKSTLINALAGKVMAKVGNEPAVTKRQQKVYLDAGNIILHDTPGLLWPKFENPHSGYRLGIIGSIKNTAIDYQDIGFYAAEYLLDAYPGLLDKYYQLETIPSSALGAIEAIGAKRGARQGGGRINLHKACEILVHNIRAGDLGGLCFETPTMIQAELAQAEAKRRAKQQQKAERKSRKKTAF